MLPIVGLGGRSCIQLSLRFSFDFRRPVSDLNLFDMLLEDERPSVCARSGKCGGVMVMAVASTFDVDEMS